MKKLLLLLIVSFTLITGCATNNEAKKSQKSSSVEVNSFVTKEAGRIIFGNIDNDKEAVKFNQTVDSFDNVTVVDCGKSLSRYLVSVSLSEFNEMDIDFDFSCDLKVVNTTGATTDIIWMINEVNAGLPQISREVVESDKWTHFSGQKRLSLGENRTFYISPAGIDKENITIYIKNFKTTIYSDEIGKEKVKAVSWKDEPSLAKAYEPYFDYIGFATPLRGVLENPDVLEGLSYQGSCFTMENEFKPDFIFAWQSPSSYMDFTAEDGKTYKVPKNTPPMNNINRILSIAQKFNLKMRGHVLVWHSQTPDWFFKEDYKSSGSFVDEATMNARLEWYIKTVLEYIKNWEENNNNGERIVITWDVVNEAASDNASASQWLRTDSNWFRIYKSDRFIVNAFRYANKYAPKDVLLAYNDYGCSSPNKCSAILKIIDAIQKAPDARIDILGMQSHIGMNTKITGHDSFETSVQKFVNKGLNVQITELDIGQDGQSYNSGSLKLKYKEFFTMCLNNRRTEDKKGIRGITLWGIVDERSWIYNSNGTKQHPLLFEKNYVCKPAFYGVLEAVEEYNN